jgi:hypothetical protein
MAAWAMRPFFIYGNPISIKIIAKNMSRILLENQPLGPLPSTDLTQKVATKKVA